MANHVAPLALGLAAIGFCMGCSQAPVAKTAPPEEAKAPPRDETPRFPLMNQTHMELVTDHLLGKAFMPGGNLARYHTSKADYEEFLGKMPDAQSAGFLLVDWKNAMTGPEYLAHMGGYFGMDKGRPVYVFTKGAWVAGVVGLPRSEADPLARDLASRI